MPEPDLDRWAREMGEPSKGSLWAGVGLTVALHVVMQVLALFILGAIVSGERGLVVLLAPLMYIGLSQLVYMIPAFLIVRRRGYTETVKGLIVGAALTFLLNSACTGLFLLKR